MSHPSAMGGLTLLLQLEGPEGNVQPKLRRQRLSYSPRNFSLCVGTTVPTSVRVVEAPPALIEIHPQWRGQLYFIVDDQ